MTTILSSVYILSVIILSLYGALGFLTFALFHRHRKSAQPLPTIDEPRLPVVTVQLPIFNEVAVVERLINAAAALDYPREKLEIQVLDDSTDATTAVAAAIVDRHRADGIDIRLIHRDDRTGFKAGALAEGTAVARGDYLAIFDADFEPAPDFLRRTVPHFINRPRLGLVQTRWGHLNPDDSILTGAQAIALDKHFAMEQFVRQRADLYPKFNGSAGIWRRSCIEDAGGWQSDTVCEDLCLSTRAVIDGWEVAYLPEIVAPAELPVGILAYKNQQARWAQGSSQCLRKYGLQIAFDRRKPLFARLYALMSMSAYMTHWLMLIILLLQIPLLLLGYAPPRWLIIATIAGLGQPLLFIAAQQVLHRDWLRRLRYLPGLLLIAVGMAPSNARAIAQGLAGSPFTFARTPKGRRNPYGMPADAIWIVEAGLLLYAAAGLIIATYTGNTAPVALLATCVLGFGYVLLLEALDLLGQRRSNTAYSPVQQTSSTD